MVHCGRTIAAEEGVKALWKGLTPFVGQLTLKYALRMGSNAFFLDLLRSEVRRRGGEGAGRCLWAIGSCASGEVGASPPAAPGRSLWQGIPLPPRRTRSVSVAGDSPAHSSSLPPLPTPHTPTTSLPTTTAAAPQDGKLTQGARLGAGLGAGVSEALLIVTPFEVVKTRLQQQKGSDKALLKYRVRPACCLPAACCCCGGV